MTIEPAVDGTGWRLCCKIPGTGDVQCCDLDAKFNNIDDLKFVKSVTEFNNLHAGDLDHMCNLIGMLNCSGSSCPWRLNSENKFGEGQGKVRPRENIDSDCTTFLCNTIKDLTRKRKSKTSPVNGVQSRWLMKLDPAKILAPTLHVETGLVNKFNEELANWMQLCVEQLPAHSDKIRERC